MNEHDTPNTKNTSTNGRAREPGGEVAQVHYLPSHQPERRQSGAVESAGPVLDGELVSEAEYRRLTSHKALALERYRGYRRDVQVAAAVTRRVVTHERTVSAGRAVVRNVLYVPAGAAVLVKRLRDARTNSRYERLLDAAEAAGDQDALREWDTRAKQADQSRHQRRMDLLEAPGKLARAVAVLGATLVGVLLALGVVLAVADRDPARILGPISGALDVVRWIVWALTVVWGPLVLAAPWLGVLYLWQLGRRRGSTPDWVAPAAARTAHASEGEPVTPSIVVTAFRDLGIAALRKAIERLPDHGAGMVGTITLAGCGVEVDVTLPAGATTTAEIERRRRRLAENLDRHEHEVFTSIVGPRTLRLWIADPGALDQPIGPSPLVIDPDLSADLYTGRAPWGQTLRGEALALPLLMRHLLITGLSNQGKTAALRALALWLLLDVIVELRIADLKGVGDWRMFDGLATTLIQGPTDEHVIAATEMLEDAVEEMNRRIAALEASGATDGVTRQMARSGQGFHPVFLIVDEAQVGYMCPAKGLDGRPYGGTKATSRFFMAARKLHNQGRAVNLHLWQGTQDPTDQNLPKLVREGAHIRAALVLGTEEQARMALGDKAVNGGAAPHKLRQGLDKGTLVVTGDGVPLATGQSSITVRTHYISGEDATAIADHARDLRTHADDAAESVEVRDLLADVAEVLGGQDKVKAADVAARLREHAPSYPLYTSLTGEALVDALGRLGVPVRLLDGSPTVRADRVHNILTLRNNEGEGDGS